MPMDQQGREELGEWISGLERLATPSLAGSAVFADGQIEADDTRRMAFAESEAERTPTGRAAERLLVCRLAEIREPGAVASGPDGDEQAEDLDARLWRCVFDPDRDPLALVATEGALQAEEPASSLEAWTEVDLAALHALWWCARLRQSRSIGARVRDAVLWHVDTIQPDNGTGRPWAVQAFALLGIEEDDDAARLHAQGLVHAARVATDRPDRFTACILLDAARGMERVLDRQQ